MTNTPPPSGPGGQPLPPGLDPDAFSPFGTGSPQPDPTSPPPSPGDGQGHPSGPAYEPTVVDSQAAPYQTDFQPGDGHGGAGDGFTPPPAPDYYGYDDHYAEPSNRTNPLLMVISGLLALIVLGGGGYFFYAQNQAAKAEQAAQIAKAESEAQAAKEEAKKALEESKKAQEAQEAAAKQAAEAEKKAAEEAAKAAQAAQAAQAPQAPGVPAPAPAAPAAPARRGPGVRPKIKDTEILGSGCTPGTNHLPNGTWFGFAYDKGNDVMHFDLVCLHRTGKIDNDNDKLRTLNANGFQYPESSFVGITVENGTVTNLWYEGS